jgi:hypothetical protein
MISGVPGWKFKRGRFTDEELEKVSSFLHNKGGKGEIFRRFINQGVDATVIERIFNELKNQGVKIDLICVDYLDLMGAPMAVYSEWDEQAKVTNSLKQLAINCNVPVLTCTQASIEAVKQEKKDNPFLNVDEVYGAKAKVHTANTIIGIVNKTATNNVQERDINEQNIHKLIFCVCKNRDGACFTYRQNMYAQTGIMEDDEEINVELDKEAEDTLKKQMEIVEEVESEFKEKESKTFEHTEEDIEEELNFLDEIGSEEENYEEYESSKEDFDFGDEYENEEYEEPNEEQVSNINKKSMDFFNKYNSRINHD